MGRGEKRSFDQLESSVDEYIYSESDHRNLTQLAVEHRPFCFRKADENLYIDLDVDTKMSSLKVSPSVVSLVSFSGEVVVSQGSGTIIEVEENNNIVLTSLNLIRHPTEDISVSNKLAENLKIVIRSSDKLSYIGDIYAYDFHYNLLIVKFMSKAPLQPAKLGMISDNVGPDRPFLSSHMSKVKPGDPVIVVGRYFYKSFSLMAAPGIFSMDRSDPFKYGCRELLTSTCKFTRCGDGGPIINVSGEVIGIAYFEFSATSPFLPIHIACKWWDHYKRNKELRHPSYGFEAFNLYLATLPMLERVLASFRSISNGVLVDEVVSGSNADSAGLREEDVITKCDGKPVREFLELWNVIWEKAGNAVELEVARADDCTIKTLDMVVGEATPNELNRWPRHDAC